MSLSSHTGLISSPKKPVLKLSQNLPSVTNICAITQKAQLTLRPFAAIYNPYSKNCSVLCNHPATPEIKSVVKQAKKTWKNDGTATGLNNEKENANRKANKNGRNSDDLDILEHVPEEFFRRFTDTDSRPLTPTPTIISSKTRASISSIRNTRRCVTPEPKNFCTIEKKQLILDLRRSHSQETIYWNASSELSPGPPQEWIPPFKQKQIVETVSETIIETNETPTSKEIPVDCRPMSCIYAKDEYEDDVPRRRGKRRKKNRNQETTTFRPNQDPETQVAACTPDSANVSTRTSLAVNGSLLHSQTKSWKQSQLPERTESMKNSSFLDDDLLSLLRRGISVNAVENNFSPLMNIALKEAIRTIPFEKEPPEPEVVKQVKENLDLPQIDHEKWLTLPRKYTRLVSRFELPIDSTELCHLTPLDYLSKYVQISDYRKQLYHRVFIKYIPEIKIDDFSDSSSDHEGNIALEYMSHRYIPIADVANALQLALHPNGTPQHIEHILEVLCLRTADHQPIPNINFRLWCGIVAFAERYMTNIHKENDIRHEIEITDFESLHRRLNGIKIQAELKDILYVIKN